MDLLQSQAIFIEKCKAKNLSEKTIEFYSYALQGFFKYLNTKKITQIEDVDAIILYGFLGYINKKYASATVKGRYLTLSVFLSFLTAMKVFDENPLTLVEKPLMPKRPIHSFNKQEVSEILDYYDKETFIGYRNYAIMSMLFGTGIRSAELLGMTLQNVFPDEHYIMVIGKGDKERKVPLGKTLSAVLKTYIKKRTSYLRNCDSLPTTNIWLNKDGDALQKSGLNTIFQTLKHTKKAWSTRVSPHTFRHTFAKFFLLNGGDLFMLQKILGHSDISVTRIYVDYDEDDMLTQNAKFNPLDNKSWKR